MSAADPVTAVVLAGGRGSRMGGEDKGLVLLAGRPLVHWVIAAVAPQVDALCLSANRHVDRYAAWGYPVFTDAHAGFAGPLAGIESALQRLETPLLLCVPCDVPLLPDDLVDRLRRALDDPRIDLAVACGDDRCHPVIALLRQRCLSSLTGFLAAGGRGVAVWQGSLARAEVPFPGTAFTNVNDAAGLADFSVRLAGEPPCA